MTVLTKMVDADVVESSVTLVQSDGRRVSVFSGTKIAFFQVLKLPTRQQTRSRCLRKMKFRKRIRLSML